MKKSTLISLFALLVAVVGVLIALAAYFSKKKETVCDDFDDELLYDDFEEDSEYYEADLEDEEYFDCGECCGEEECCCEECCEEAVEEEAKVNE